MIVALWFGALFGLGSLAIRPSLLEAMVISSHISSIIPAAAPPLGVTARILLALIMTGLGGLLGSLIGRRIARPKSEAPQREPWAAPIEVEVRQRPRDAHPDAPARRPISALDEIGADEISDVFAGRRRSLTITDHAERDAFQDFAPLPGGLPQILDIAENALPAQAEGQTPLNLGDFACEHQPGSVADAEPSAPARFAQADDLEKLDMVALAERLAQAMKRRRSRSALPFASTEPITAPFESGEESCPEPVADEPGNEAEEAIGEEEGYSSLLNLSRTAEPRQTFVRIEAPPAEQGSSIEPVVIFPGQAARVAAAQTSANGTGDGSEAVLATGPANFRRFDGPASVSQDQSIAHDSGTTGQNPEETERALRAALNSLQRMSGAA